MERVSIQVGKPEPYGLQQSEEQVSYLALDIGGSLIKIVYFSSRDNSNSYDQNERKVTSNRNLNYKALRGRLHFLKFETSKIDEWIGFISSKQIRDCGNQDGDDDAVPASDKKVIKATGGGAFKFADLFQEKFNILLDKVDEMSCLVAGANFLLKAVPREAFTYMAGQKEYVQIDHEDLYPYLLVNIGSGVSMIKVDGDDKFERVSGTNVGGGTFWGLGKLLTQCKSFDELLELSKKGDNKVIDMLVGDIYGTDYSKIGLTSTAIASSFGKAISENKELEDYKSEDLTRSLLRMISNNIGQIAYLNALQFGLKRIFFGGFFTRGHAYTMDTISVAVHFWSKGEAKALFLRHEGFLGALGAFRSYETNWSTDVIHELVDQHSPTVKSSSSGKESSSHENVQDYGCIDCSVQVRI